MKDQPQQDSFEKLKFASIVVSVCSKFDPRHVLGMSFFFRLLQRVAGREKAAPRIVEILAVKSGDRVLDIGCGTADILRYLPRDIDYHGFDVSESYVSAARIRFGARGSFSVQAVTPEAADRLGRFDIVIALGVLHHLTDAEAKALFTVANKILRPGGRVVTCDGALVAGQNPLARLLLRLDRGRYVRTPEEYTSIARRSFPDATARVVHDLLFIPYTHCIVVGARASQ
jgi:SAM-dependent methyltransferase